MPVSKWNWVKWEYLRNLVKGKKIMLYLQLEQFRISPPSSPGDCCGVGTIRLPSPSFKTTFRISGRGHLPTLKKTGCTTFRFYFTWVVPPVIGDFGPEGSGLRSPYCHQLCTKHCAPRSRTPAYKVQQELKERQDLKDKWPHCLKSSKRSLPAELQLEL